MSTEQIKNLICSNGYRRTNQEKIRNFAFFLVQHFLMRTQITLSEWNRNPKCKDFSKSNQKPCTFPIQKQRQNALLSLFLNCSVSIKYDLIYCLENKNMIVFFYKICYNNNYNRFLIQKGLQYYGSKGNQHHFKTG